MSKLCLWHISVTTVTIYCNLLYVQGDVKMRTSVFDSRNLKTIDVLSGVHVRLSLYEQGPLFWIIKHPSAHIKNSTFVVEGMYADLMSDMAHRYNMTYEYVLVNQLQWILKGFFESFMDQLLRNETDFVPSMFPRTLEYSQKMYLGSSVQFEQFNLLQPFPQMETRLTAPIRPFTFQVWLLFVFSNMAFIIVLTMVMLYNERQEPDQQSFSRIAYKNWEYVVTILLAQGNSDFRSISFSLRLLVGLWLLLMVVVINAYTGTLTSFVTSPTLEPTVDNFDQLVERGKTLTTMKGLLNDMFLNASSGANKVIGDKFRENPGLLFTDFIRGTSNVYKYGCIFFGASFSTEGMMEWIANQNDGNKCLVTAKPLPFYRDGTFAIRKEWPYKEIISQRFLQYLSESGIFKQASEMYFPKTNKCNPKLRRNTESFSLEEFSSIFLILIIGLGLSSFVFFFELIFGFLKKKCRK